MLWLIESIEQDRNKPISRRCQLSQTLSWGTLRKDLALRSLKNVLSQELELLDHHKHREFVDVALKQLENDNNFFKKIMLSKPRR